MSKYKFEFNEESCEIRLGNKVVGTWNNDANTQYPEDLVWGREITKLFETAFTSGVGHAAPDRMKYLGVLGLLAEASVHVPEDIRERIESAMDDACADGRLKWRRILNRIEVEANPDYKEKQ